MIKYQKFHKPTVICVIFAFLLLVLSNVSSADGLQIKKILVDRALGLGVPPTLALAVAKVESDFNPNALSSVGARGIMQIMPQTAREEYGATARSLWNPEINIQIGVDYLYKLYKQYDQRWDLALSHYNGGTLRGRGGDAKPHRYTRKYVNKVFHWQERFRNENAIFKLRSRLEVQGVNRGNGIKILSPRKEVRLKNILDYRNGQLRRRFPWILSF
ncbi:MAG: lytic transglycosylase domain-containing protein [Rhodospirillales bacterium]|nr:lytic transglycosylase domain-containing protein [Rhodospirillales bacterium]